LWCNNSKSLEFYRILLNNTNLWRGFLKGTKVEYLCQLNNKFQSGYRHVRTTDKKHKLRTIRRQLGLNQQEFWSRIGVTQSGGSRYETGRAMPKPVRELLRLVHIEGIDLARAKGEHFAVAARLRATNPPLYQRLRQEVRNLPRKSSRQ
jgi:DNA-binding transcriptional regulator YiaG